MGFVRGTRSHFAPAGYYWWHALSAFPWCTIRVHVFEYDVHECTYTAAYVRGSIVFNRPADSD